MEQLPNLTEIPAEMEESINRQKAHLRRMGAVNPEAQTEYQSVVERFEYLKTQIDDLHKADVDLCQIIRELDEVMERDFKQTFKKVASEFEKMFTRLFGGGSQSWFLPMKIILLKPELILKPGCQAGVNRDFPCFLVGSAA